MTLAGEGEGVRLAGVAEREDSTDRPVLLQPRLGRSPVAVTQKTQKSLCRFSSFKKLVESKILSKSERDIEDRTDKVRSFHDCCHSPPTLVWRLILPVATPLLQQCRGEAGQLTKHPGQGQLHAKHQVSRGFWNI